MDVRVCARMCAVALCLVGGVERSAVADGPRPGTRCPRAPVRVFRTFGYRHTEEARLVLTRCDGSPNVRAITELSVLARPGGTERPRQRRSGLFVAPGV